MDLLGDRWTLLVVRELMTGPKRFGAIRANLPGISANLLTQRLTELEAAGVLVHRDLPPPANVAVYELTDWGYESEPVFQALGRWGARSPWRLPDQPFSAASLVLSLGTMFQPRLAQGIHLKIGLRVGAESYLADVGPRGLSVTAAPDLPRCDATLSGAPEDIAGFIYFGQPGPEIIGNQRSAERFAACFTLPPEAPRP